MSQDINDFIFEMKLRGKTELETVKAIDLKIGDTIKVMNVVNQVNHIDDAHVYYSVSCRALKLCNRIGLKSQERIELLTLK